MQLAASKDTESDLLQRLDMLSKDNDELVTKVNTLQDKIDDEADEKKNYKDASDVQEELEKMKKTLQTEKMLKQQAVNKLAQILNQKPQSAGAARKLNSAELKKKEKENRKLQQDLTTEKEKFNQMVAKYQKDLQDLQVIMFYIAYL